MKEKLKKIFSRKKVLIISGVGVLLFVIFFLGMSIFSSWWKMWPSNVRFSIAFNRLAISVYENPYCHLDCFLERQVYESEISSNLNRAKTQDKIAQTIFNEEENISWRLELLGIIFKEESLSTWPLFKNLQLYLDKNDANLQVQNVIANYLALNGFNVAYSEKLKSIVADNSVNTEERLISLKMLGQNNKNLADFYFQLLRAEEDENLKIELLRVFGSDEDRFDIDIRDVTNVFEEIILNPKSSSTSLRLLVFILSDYLTEEFEADVVALLFTNLIGNSNLDIFTKYLIIDILNTKFPEELKLAELCVLPQINQSEWHLYYEQK